MKELIIISTSNIYSVCVRVCVCVCVYCIGVWKVVARFHSKPEQSFSAEFEVKEYGESEQRTSQSVSLVLIFCRLNTQ